MAAAAQAPSSDLSGSGATEGGVSPEDTVLFVGISLVLGIASRHLLRGTRVPYTVALLVIGIVLGSLEYGTSHGLGKIGNGIRLWSHINPDLLLIVFLPALLFESSFSMEVHQIKRCMAQMVLLAGPGVLISTFSLGAALKMTFPYNWDWKTSLLLGGLLSATDPVAVVALLKELGASKKLSTIIEGESLMNDGTAIVVYQLFYQMVIGRSFSTGDAIKFLSRVSLGAVGLGLAFGIASVIWLGFIFNDTVIEITLTLAVSYLAYFTAQDAADVSGVLTVMTLGMFYAAFAKTAFKGDSQKSLHHFWEMVAYIANTLIFILSGVVIAEGVLDDDSHFARHGTSWGYLILLFVFLQLSRVLVVGLLYPLLRYLGYGLDWKESVILIWSGLRGAVALSLSISVKRSSGILDQPVSGPQVGTLFVFFTGGIVFLTLVLNGSTVQFILHLLGMDKLSTSKIRILNYTRNEMLNKALESFEELGDDEELGPADWPTVQKYITCLSNLDENQVHPHNVSESERHLKTLNLRDTRVRFLNGVQAAYWEMLEEGRIAQTTANILMRSIDEAIDMISTEPLCDWKSLKSHVNFPSHYQFFQVSRLPRRLITYFMVERLELGCYICAAFLRAHRISRRLLHDFIGESEIASIVIEESKQESEEAQKFLEYVRAIFPQVLRVVKTRQVTYSILKHLSDYVQNLEKTGLLEEKEMLHLEDAVQTDLKKLLRNPPMVKMPKISDLLSAHPLLGALPSSVRTPLESSTKETIKLRGVYLYKEGSKPNGIWLISIGVVKWTSKDMSNKHSLDPTFSHGNTLGLYEVLTGRSYISDMVADSVVHCFFIESDKILSLITSDPDIEDFLWQESVIVIAKILLPQIFENMPVQDLRGIIVERSTMNIYIRGEVIKIRPKTVGFLLEGFIKKQDAREDLIKSPAALLPSHTELSFLGLEFSGVQNVSFCHTGSWYHVETRARVIFFEMGTDDTDGILQGRSASWISQSAEFVRSNSKERGSMLSWPEKLYEARGRHQNFKVSNRRLASLSEKAMELSIYGSMLDGKHKRHRNYQSTSSFPAPHSLSYPGVPSITTSKPRLLSIKSEGGIMKERMTTEPRRLALPPGLQQPNRKGKAADDNSSDESGGEEIIVRVDSPSTLSFHQASET